MCRVETRLTSTQVSGRGRVHFRRTVGEIDERVADAGANLVDSK